MLALELEQLLKKQGEAALAAQVPQLKVVDRCRCGDNFCSSFYTQPKPEGSYGPGHRPVALSGTVGQCGKWFWDNSTWTVSALDQEQFRPQATRVS
jgi:hypothetical protein